jgi:two-component system response regulator NreC
MITSLKIRVLIADDHAMVRAGLRALLGAQSDIEVVGEAEDGVAAVEKCLRLKPNVVVMDLTMPGRGGINATEDIRHECPGVKVLVLTMHDDEAYVRQALLAGASGYVLKRALASDLIRAIRTVHTGKMHIPAGVQLDVSLPRSGKMEPVELLTGREREVVTLIALGHTNSEIADQLHISEKTVETHRAHIFEKLSFQSRADLVRFALEHGLLKS